MAGGAWNSGGCDGWPDACVGQIGFPQAAGGPAIRRKKLASLFPNSNLHFVIYYPDSDYMDHPLLSPIIRFIRSVHSSRQSVPEQDSTPYLLRNNPPINWRPKYNILLYNECHID